MRKIYISVILCLTIFNAAFSQTNYNGTIPSGYKNRGDVQSMETLNLLGPTQTEIENVKNGNDPRAGQKYLIGLDIPVHLNTSNSGIWTGYEGYKTWRLKVKSSNAQALLFRYSEFMIPKGAAVYVYNSSFTHKSRAYQGAENPSGQHFSTEVIVEDEIVLEYYAPDGIEEMPSLEIEGVGYIFRDGQTFQPRNYQDNGSSESCEVNVNCTEGTNWQDPKRGVAKILMPESGGYGLCSGSLVNNTAQNCRNYFLTAEHCGGGDSPASLNQWQFYFNFESPNCSNLNTSQANAVDNQVVTGCTRRASSGTVTDVQKSDFLLVELNSTIPSSYNVYYNGWDRNATAATSGVGIHHPAGDIKKISTYSAALTTSSWSGSNTNKHWQVTWTATTSGHGVTEGGSSGSPIFNQNKRIVGDLSGGSSLCSSTSSPDLYGKFVYSWDQCGTTNALQLKPWLDSANTGATTLDGRNACNLVAVAPVADFTGTPTTVISGNNVTFTQTSTNNPTSFAWVITPNTGFTYVSGTSASSANPIVQFTTVGQYTVALTATNSSGSNTKTKTNYITVTAVPAPVADFTANLTSIMTGGSVNFTQTSTNNPTSFSWSVTPNTGIVYQSGTSSISANPVIQFNTAGQYTIALTASNSSGSNTKTKTSYITVYSNAGIADIGMGSILKVYPNPTTDLVNIQIDQPLENEISVRVMDMVGKEIVRLQKAANTNLIQIPTDTWAAGIYQIEIRSGNLKHVQKVIKN